MVRDSVARVTSALHEDVLPLAFLLGTWRGEGSGGYPTIEPFEYGEAIAFDHVGDAYLTYVQRSWSPEGEAVHLERGFLRPGAGGEWELTLAHPLGLTEVAHGRLEGTSLEFATEDGGIARTRTGLDVTGIRRRYLVDGDVLTYSLDMATERTPYAVHLEASLRRGAP
jgi:hypothetical protein